MHLSGLDISNEDLLDIASIYNDEVDLSEMDADASLAKWSHSVIERLRGPKLKTDFICNATLYIWKPKGCLEVIPMGDKVFIFKLSCEAPS